MNVKRILDELNVIDDFLLNEIITDKQYGKEFVQYFLKTVLGHDIHIKDVNAQMIATSGDSGKRAIRMDVLTETAFQKGTVKLHEGTIVDIEMQAQKKQTNVGEKFDLHKRSRFYQSVIDVNILDTGQDFGDLNDVLIIICTPFDLFGKNRVIYTFEHSCQEDSELHLIDGAKRIFLNTKGLIGATAELKEMLNYIEESTEKNAINADLKHIHKIVTSVKSAKERRERYMWAFEREMMIRDEGEEIGEQRGKELGQGRVNQLIRTLIENSRIEDVNKAVNNLEYQKILFQEFKI